MRKDREGREVRAFVIVAQPDRDCVRSAASCACAQMLRDPRQLARAQRAPFLGYVDVEPAMAPLLQDPACRALLRHHGFRSGG
jgi:hypothetical protein